MSTNYDNTRRIGSINDVGRYGSISDDVRHHDSISDDLKNVDKKDCRYASNVIGVAVGKIIYYTFRLFGRLLCIGKVGLIGRIAALWFWIIALALGGGLIVWRVLYLRQDISSSVTDMRLVSKKGDTIFCSDITVTSSDVIDMYLLPIFPTLQKRRYTYNIPHTATLTSDSFWYRKFYLIAGSSLHVIGNVTGDWINMYFIKGDDNMEEWKTAKFCTHCYLKKGTLINGEHFEYTLDITGSDDYFILYSKSGSGIAQISIDIYLNKTEYDISSFSDRCIASTDCNFELELFSQQTVLITVDHVHKSFELQVAVLCTAINWIYIVLFLAVPLLTGICASSIIYKIGKLLKKRHQDLPTIDENDDLNCNDRRYLIVDEENIYTDSISGPSDHPISYVDTCSHSGHNGNQLLGETRIQTERISALRDPEPTHTQNDRQSTVRMCSSSNEAIDRNASAEFTRVEHASLTHVTSPSLNHLIPALANMSDIVIQTNETLSSSK